MSKINTSIGLLILRLGAGGMMLLLHGWGKLTGFAEKSAHFPDPLGVGSTISLSLTVGAEVFCAVAIILGLATRLAAIPLTITMLVAVFVIHANDPWSQKELGMIYLIAYATLALTGPGKLSLDYAIFKKS